jgi:hypothetical protein
VLAPVPRPDPRAVDVEEPLFDHFLLPSRRSVPLCP